MQRFMQYIALGDSMSIDLYPSLDLDKSEIRQLPIGAASLFWSNHDATWPECSGMDLCHRYPGIRFLNVSADGATTDDVLGKQVPAVSGSADRSISTLFTLTAGGNDLLIEFGAGGDLSVAVQRIALRYSRILAHLLDSWPDACVLVTTVYDPTDGTGILRGMPGHERLPIEHLHRLNDLMRQHADGERVMLADVHAHFRGHGHSVPASGAWYWARNPIEPNARGAHEIRCVWLETLGRQESSASAG